MSRKHPELSLLFKDQAVSMKNLAGKEDAVPFALGSHSKKRPDNLMLGRMIDGHLLDMYKLGVNNFKALSDFKNERAGSELKPCLMFSSPGWESSPEMTWLWTMLVDLFRGLETTNMILAGSAHAPQFTSPAENQVLIRSYKIALRKYSDQTESGRRLPRADLKEIKPSLDLTLRGSYLASVDLYDTACKQVKSIRGRKKVKNVEEDKLQSMLGRPHVLGQDVSRVQTCKMKGLREAMKAQRSFAWRLWMLVEFVLSEPISE